MSNGGGPMSSEDRKYFEIRETVGAGKQAMNSNELLEKIKSEIEAVASRMVSEYVDKNPEDKTIIRLLALRCAAAERRLSNLNRPEKKARAPRSAQKASRRVARGEK